MELLSKELLAEVLGVQPIVEMEYEFDNDYNTYFIRTNSGKEGTGRYFFIDPTITIVSDLAHKCKEWAKHLGYCISILDRPNGLCTITLSYGIDFDYEKSFSYKKGIHGELHSSIGCTILACQWILEERNIRCV